MFPKSMKALGTKRSVIRELFEYGNKRKEEIGKENVFDFSLGNPSVPAPETVEDAIRHLMATESPIALHGYTSAPGDRNVRAKIASHINTSFEMDADESDLYLTVGAAASLCICFNALLDEGDEVLALAPYFPEYKVFVEKAGGVFRTVPCRELDFQIDVEALQASINENTAAVIVNSPNNPSGVVLTEETIQGLSRVLSTAAKKIGHPIYIIADEPYRELVYGNIEVPYIPRFYKNTIVCYSFSKSLSLPGERIGYIYVPKQVENAADILAGVQGAGRALGYVCAPSLFQRVAAACLGQTANLSVYKTNRDLLYNALTQYGYDVVHPDGAFYLFMRAPEPDAVAFSERAKKYEILVVPSDDFGMPGYVRISYCVDTDTVRRALPAFKKLAEEYSLMEVQR